jgi:molybdopterin-binding protein
VVEELDLSLGEAAKAIGVSVDTLRRWERQGKLETHRDSANRRRVRAAEIRRLSAGQERHRTGVPGSARNRFPGTIKSVEVGGVMALVEIEAGPFRVTAAITRDSVEELRLAPGVSATAIVKATSVMVERGHPGRGLGDGEQGGVVGRGSDGPRRGKRSVGKDRR